MKGKYGIMLSCSDFTQLIFDIVDENYKIKLKTKNKKLLHANIYSNTTTKEYSYEALSIFLEQNYDQIYNLGKDYIVLCHHALDLLSEPQVQNVSPLYSEFIAKYTNFFLSSKSKLGVSMYSKSKDTMNAIVNSNLTSYRPLLYKLLLNYLVNITAQLEEKSSNLVHRYKSEVEDAFDVFCTDVDYNDLLSVLMTCNSSDKQSSSEQPNELDLRSKIIEHLTKCEKLRPASNDLVQYFINQGLLNPDEIESLYNNHFFSDNDIISFFINELLPKERVCSLLGVDKIGKNYMQNIRNYQTFAQRQSKYAGNYLELADHYLELLTNNDILRLYMSGTINPLPNIEFTFGNLLSLTEEEYLNLSRISNRPINLALPEDVLSSHYVTKYSGKTLIELSKLGQLSPTTILGLYERQHNNVETTVDSMADSMKSNENGTNHEHSISEENTNKDKVTVEPEDTAIQSDQQNRALSLDDLLDFYNPESVVTWLGDEEQDVDFQFLERLYNSVLGSLDSNTREQYLSEFQEQLSILEQSKPDFFENTLSSEALTKEMANEFFNNKMFTIRELGLVYGDDEQAKGDVIASVHNLKLDPSALGILSPEDVEAFFAVNELTIDDVFLLYSQIEAIDITKFGELYDYYIKDESQNNSISIASLINNDTPIEKLIELIYSDLLEDADIESLKENNKIDSDQYNTLKNVLIRRKFLNSSMSSVVEVSDAGNPNLPTPGENLESHSNPSRVILPEGKIREFFEAFLGECDYRPIHGTDDKGFDSPFAGYTAILTPAEIGLVVLENFSELDNATYIMTYQQLEEYTKILPNGEIILKVGKIGKKDENDNVVREGILEDKEHYGKTVFQIAHDLKWGGKIIDTSVKLSNSLNIAPNLHLKLANAYANYDFNSRQSNKSSLDKSALENAFLNNRILWAERFKAQLVERFKEKGIPLKTVSDHKTGKEMDYQFEGWDQYDSEK